MLSETGKNFEQYARDCVRLAEQPNTPPELCEQLLQMAREWVQTMMEEEDERPSDGDDSAWKMPSSPSR
jgi:hypothetical protein